MTPISTTYLGYDICIEAFEWGYLAQVVEPDLGKRLIAVNATALGALERAFELIDGSLEAGRDSDSQAREARAAR